MSTQSPPLIRKATGHPGSQGPNMSPREGSPSPSFRERQRTVRGQSISYQSQHGGQPSPTASHASFNNKRSPPPATQAPPPASRKPSSPTYQPTSPRGGTPEILSPPPPPVQSMSQPNIHQQVPSHAHPPAPQHSMSTPLVHQFLSMNGMSATAPANPNANSIPNTNPNSQMGMGYPRPIPRVPPPQFLMETFQMTPQFMAEIDQAHAHQLQQQNLSGMAGVAYAGGASSGAVPKHFEAGSPPKDHPVMERLKAADRVSPKEPDRDRERAVRRESRDKDTLGRRGSLKRDAPQQPQREASPTYHTPMATPGEHTANYVQYEYERDAYAPESSTLPTSTTARKSSSASTSSAANVGPSHAHGESPTQRGTPPTAAKLASQTSPVPAFKARTPDKSLPVQEEAEEEADEEPPSAADVQAPETAQQHEPWRHEDYDRPPRGTSPTPSSDLHPEGHGHPGRYEERMGMEHGGQANRNGGRERERERDDDRPPSNGRDDDEDARSQEEESFTPRSPVASLPESRALTYGGRDSPMRQTAAGRIKNRNGSTDQLGLRSFDPTVFNHAVEALKQPQQPPPPPQHAPSLPQVQTQLQMHPPPRSYSQGSDRYASNGQYHPDEQEDFLNDPAAAYYQHSFMHSPASTHSRSHVRPGAPVPPTPHSQTAAPSPSPLISGMSSTNGPKPSLPPYSPAPPGGSPYPYPYGHIRRGQSNYGYGGSQTGTLDLSQYDPAVVREQLALQMQIYALNNGGMVSDSTLSPSSTPYPGPGYNPWAYLQTTRVFGGHAGAGDASASIRSSPSHEPVPLPLPALRSRSLRRRERSMNLRSGGGGLVGPGAVRKKVKPPPRVESTQPRETSPELSSGEETAGEDREEQYGSSGNTTTSGAGTTTAGAGWAAEESGEDSGEWVDDDFLDGDEDDLLQLEFHTDYVSNPEKRRRRWKTRWDALVRAFHALDRETDTTLLLLAAPPHSSKLHSVTSRALRRERQLAESLELANLRAAFSTLAARRRATRAQVGSLIDRIALASGSAASADGSPGRNEAREEDLRRALEAALGSLSALGNIYDEREVRWKEEMRRLDEDKEKVKLLLSQVLGVPMITDDERTAVSSVS